MDINCTAQRTGLARKNNLRIISGQMRVEFMNKDEITQVENTAWEDRMDETGAHYTE